MNSNFNQDSFEEFQAAYLEARARRVMFILHSASLIIVALSAVCTIYLVAMGTISFLAGVAAIIAHIACAWLVIANHSQSYDRKEGGP